MPADQRVLLPIGSGGLNLRASPVELASGELTDTLNWQIDQNGALVKRLGMHEWSDPTPAAILELMVLQIAAGSTYFVAHCADGQVYSTTDGITWTSIDSGLSGTVRVGWCQYLDKLYYCDGNAAMRQWDGTTLTALPATNTNDVQTVTITGTPTSGSFKLGLNGFETGDIDFDASAADVQAALVALADVTIGDVVCTGGDLPGTGVVCTFGGNYASQPVTLMTTQNALAGGTAPAPHVAHTTTGSALVPKGRYLTVWRNRLWIAGVPSARRRVYWSKAGLPGDFSYLSNYVDFPDDTAITALAAAPNIATGADGSDGVLVFSKNRIHRIYDDSDNVGQNVTGGANQLIDESNGCLSHRSIGHVAGRIWFLTATGIFSTDGHAQAREESLAISPLMQTLSWSSSEEFVGIGWNGRYLFAYTPAGLSDNTRLLEAYADLPREPQHPWMAHDTPVASWVQIPQINGNVIYAADASSGDTAYVRKMFEGGYDIDGDAGQNPISARARTGALLLGTSQPKRMRRIEVFGRGQLTIGVSSDLESSSGETQLFDMMIETRVWSTSDTWGSGVWGGGGGSRRDTRYYVKRGRYMTFELVESSTAVSIHDRALGYSGSEAGGAAAYSIVLKLTPLDSEV